MQHDDTDDLSLDDLLDDLKDETPKNILSFADHISKRDTLDEENNSERVCSAAKELSAFKRQDKEISLSPSAFDKYLRTEYGKRIFDIMKKYGMGEGDIDMILFNTFSEGVDTGRQVASEELDNVYCNKLQEVIKCYQRDKIIECDTSVLDEAASLISKDRNNQYGKAAANLGETGKMWSVILGTDIISAHQVALCMIALKLVREKYKHKRDNIVDGIGYFALAQDLA